ncbi:hypothetical protein GCM10011387_12660 [Pedobacter quisquiliarum]|uniref:YdhG-like domain-containing protein n=1 Tax=Pedobacter quisquiliarum TaxID=1834438 RepID=A0A916XCH8_9SPHI|nr:YdeI/OmpD-associated family protein [Pedobacter quisquiliarum]GGC60508.1 hypothetical protein GCM10011387_12660 [Pedobacter quisquiliarum]
MEKVNSWRAELDLLVDIISRAGLSSTIKWGTDVFTYKGKNVVGIAGFKDYVALWFYNGVFLKDEHQVLQYAQEGKTKALRQLRFYNKEDIVADLILEYVKEAMALVDAGKRHKPEKLPRPAMPDLLDAALESNTKLKLAFEQLPPYKQKDYIEHIASAKRAETQLARLEQILPMILNGEGLHDKYGKR